jgi:hypothetical protein
MKLFLITLWICFTVRRDKEHFGDVSKAAFGRGRQDHG